MKKINKLNRPVPVKKKEIYSSFSSEDQINLQMMDFIAKSPTPFHAVSNLVHILSENNFTELKEENSWDLKTGGRYFVCKNQSSIVAFVYGQQNPEVSGFKIIGAHTDAPALKVKPNPEKHFKNFLQLGVEIYGGVLLAPWFDRDLSLAGRVHYQTQKGEVESSLIDFKKALATIPSLAIHLNRTVNEAHSINAQKEMPPIIMQTEHHGQTLRQILENHLRNEGISIKKVLDYELSFYDVNSPNYVGIHNDFISSARLDNLLSCFVGVSALIAGLNTKTSATKVLVCQDHEEVGSCSSAGAEGPFLPSILERINKNRECYFQSVGHSLMISSDNAHGIHPNYPEKHDENHGPLLNAGPVIKMNANQRYATNSETAASFVRICEDLKIPYQRFVVRSDMACGSTIGPITAANVGLKVVDVGVPTFAMHSIRELCGRKDSYFLYLAFNSFYSREDI